MDLALVGAIYEFLAKEYGGALDPQLSFPSTGVVFASVVGNDPDAMALLFVNNGAQPIFLTLRQSAAASTGVFLAANGGFLSLTARDDFILPALEWFAASPAGASSLFVLRMRRISREGN